jgi:hypothetical protein
MCCYGGVEESKECDGEGKVDSDAAATFVHAVAPVGVPSAAAVGLHGELRGRRKSCCSAELRPFRKDQVTRRDSVARRATSDNWRLAEEQGPRKTWPATTDAKVVCVCDSLPTRGSQAAEAENADENETEKPRALTKRKGAERAARRRRKM